MGAEQKLEEGEASVASSRLSQLPTTTRARMNSAISCILVLACIVNCASQAVIDCRCVKMSKGMDPSLIAGVKEYPPRPYCNRQEVIAILKDGSSRCLDPLERFTIAVLQTIEMQRAIKAARNRNTLTSTTTRRTTTTSPAGATASPETTPHGNTTTTTASPTS